MRISRAAVKAVVVKGKVASILGYVFGVPIALVMVVGIEDLPERADVMIFTVFLLAICVFAIIKGAQIKRYVKRFRMYVALMSSKSANSIEELAFSVKKPADFVRKDLQKMMSRGFFAGVYINFLTGEIDAGELITPAKAAQRIKAAECKFCGASGRIIEGQVAECEYCGSLLQ